MCLEDVTLSNGIDWSPDGTEMYYVDTASGGIDVFDFDLETAGLSRRRRFAEVPADIGAPDGLTVDADGGVWVALWGGGRVRRYTPDGGLDREIAVPRANATSCAFGGDRRQRLFITTAADEDADTPNGSLYVVDVPQAGQVSRPFAG